MPGAAGAGSWRWALVGAVVVVAVLAGALVAVVASRDIDAGEDEAATVEVVLEPVGHVSEEPFTESVVSEGVVPAELQAFSTVEGPGARPSASSDVVISQVAGDRSGLYGSTAEGAVCDADALAVRILADEEVNRVWSGVMGVDPGDSAALITAALTPVVLGRDTAVTNHGFGPDGAAPYQSVLQAGTPVMVDANGTPRAQCGCGNPLLAPDAGGGRVDLVGDVWEGFDPRQVTEVRPSDEPVTEIETVDIESREPVTVPVGGEPDTVELDGLLVADHAGVHVHGEAGERLATVIDEPVGQVFDDGAGGLVWDAPAPVDQEPAPVTDPERSKVWHLPAGAEEPEVVFESEDPGARRYELESAGRLGDRSYVVVTEIVADPSGPGLDPFEGDLVALDLGSGETEVIADDVTRGAFEDGYPSSSPVARSVSLNAEMLAYATYTSTAEYDGEVTWTLLGPGFEAIESSCVGVSTAFAADEPCPTGGTLDSSGEVVAPYLSESGDSVAGLEVGDPRAGAPLRLVEVSQGVNLTEWSGATELDVLDGRAIYSYRPEPGFEALAAIDIDLADGTSTERELPGLVRFLRAPLVRPAETDASAPEPAPPTTTTTTTTTTAPSTTNPPTAAPSTTNPPPPMTTAPPTTIVPPPELDLLNMVLPAGACGPDTLAVPLIGGEGEAGEVLYEDTVYASVQTDEAVQVDVDGDGRPETVVSVVCSFGGSGHVSPLVTLRPTSDGVEMAAEPIPFGRGDRDPTAIELDGQALIVRGLAYLDTDAGCCPSGSFTTRFELEDGAWVEVG
ncbi:DUF6777 domain-containing protein [Iamia sp.]|uniref:DUF6777 domain-containing protein n=1 Tax=Iamia sp. TaxID=2722710 RepID=UPI002B68BC9E|nr:DUF6777 domain-containing protein [Iamia sp.]HXH59153.1 DUF6777 domain-containing protein [Iamia sp.]